MSIVDRIQNIMRKENQSEKELSSDLDDISYILELDNSLTAFEIANAVSLVLDYALNETRKSVRDDLFDIILNAVLYCRASPFVDWNPLVTHLDQLSIDDLLSALLFIGFSKNDEYIPILEKYINDQNPIVRERAQISIKSIRKRL